MKKILISDTHFGVRQNSMMWLKSQEDFVYKQLIPFIKSQDEEITLVHLGDVFDSRSSVSTYVAARVIKIFEELKGIVKEVIVVAGNHDFYSPNSDEIDTNTLLLKQTGITIVSDHVMVRGEDLYVPWYEWFDQTALQETINKNGTKFVFTHADLLAEVRISGPRIFSGHIHTPKIDGRKFTLGSTYALTFADANQERGFYVLTDDEIKFYPNTVSIKFWKFNDIPDQEVSCGDYINLYIERTKLDNVEYLARVKEWIKDKRNCQLYPVETVHSGVGIECEEYNINDICEEMIPDHLKEKFKLICE